MVNVIRQSEAVNYFRTNPHRLHLGVIGQGEHFAFRVCNEYAGNGGCVVTGVF
ncbi:MAG: hypothetical protein LBS79_02465 [Tannerella sp.]|nr:hypothetical protein [Tannerella sp.]